VSLYRRRLEDQPLDFTITNEPRVFDGFRPVDGIEIRHERLAEGEPLEVRREVMRGGRAAVILPYDPALDALVLIRQFRIGAALATPHAAPLELPAGLVDDGEATQDSAARELREETGLEAEHWREIGRMTALNGVCRAPEAVYLATGLRDAADAAHDQHEEGISAVRRVPFAEALAMVRDGRITDGETVAALLYAAIALDRVR
jgi:ADP-ribose pyrophosphatase